MPSRRKRSWLFLACALAGGAAAAGELEQRLLDDLLQVIGDPGLARETRILTRLGRLYIEGRPAPAFDAGTNALILFARPWWKPVYYTTRPAADAPPPAPELAACPGESEPFTFAFYAARDARVEQVQVAPPAGPGGTLAIRPRLYRERHIFVAPEADLRVFRPFALEPVTQAVPLFSNVATRFWVDLAVPPDAPPGLYTGRVEVATDAGPFAFPYTLRVHPFTLQKPLPTEMAWGFWFPPPRDADARRRHLRLMADCGITTFAFQNWNARVDGRGEVSLETAEMDAALADARAQGLTGPYLIGIGLGEFSGSGAEYSAGWRTHYTRALRLFEEHLAKLDVPYAGLVFDEPRETNIRPCNRNREQMLLYLDLIDRAVPGLRTMVNPMSDEAGPAHPRGFYTVFAERPDIVMPHFWARSSNLIARTRQPGGAELWSYNDGPNRLGWGLHSWANRLHGRMQYAWLLTDPKDHPYAPIQRSTFEYGGRHPGMHLWAVELAGGLQPTPRLLGVREGIDDYRYLYTLERVLAQAGDSATRTAAMDWLAQLRREIPPYAHADDFVDETAAGDTEAEIEFTARLDQARAQAAAFIRQLNAP